MTAVGERRASRASHTRYKVNKSDDKSDDSDNDTTPSPAASLCAATARRPVARAASAALAAEGETRGASTNRDMAHKIASRRSLGRGDTGRAGS